MYKKKIYWKANTFSMIFNNSLKIIISPQTVFDILLYFEKTIILVDRYLIFSSEFNYTTDFVDDKTILIVHIDPKIVSNMIQAL